MDRAQELQLPLANALRFWIFGKLQMQYKQNGMLAAEAKDNKTSNDPEHPQNKYMGYEYRCWAGRLGGSGGLSKGVNNGDNWGYYMGYRGS